MLSHRQPEVAWGWDADGHSEKAQASLQPPLLVSPVAQSLAYDRH